MKAKNVQVLLNKEADRTISHSSTSIKLLFNKSTKQFIMRESTLPFPKKSYKHKNSLARL